jgi:hypothetical protein
MTTENEGRASNSQNRDPTGDETKHIIRAVGPDGMIYDVAMTDAQLKEAQRFARSSGEDEMKLSFNDAILELMRIGMVSVVRRLK